MNDVAVITVNYFGAADTKNCLRSVLRTSPGVQIIVVDNSPNDPDLQRLKTEFADDVKFIDADSNRGFGGGNNLGITWALENTTCEYVLLLNNDAQVQQGSIETLVKCLEGDRRLGAVGGSIRVDGTGETWFEVGEVDLARGGGRLARADERRTGSVLLSGFLSGAVMMLRRQVLERVGGFDEIFFMYEEDIDLSLRIRKAGYLLGVCPNARFDHRVQGSYKTDLDSEHKPRWDGRNPRFDFLVYHNVRNNIINIRKHASAAQLPRILLVYPVWLSLKTLTAARVRGASAIHTVLRGIRDGLHQTLSKQNRESSG